MLVISREVLFMLDPDVIHGIRRIFLQVRPHVSIQQATDLLDWTRKRMTAAIAAGEVVLTSTLLGKWVGRDELMAKGLEVWTLDLTPTSRHERRAVRPARLR